MTERCETAPAIDGAADETVFDAEPLDAHEPRRLMAYKGVALVLAASALLAPAFDTEHVEQAPKRPAVSLPHETPLPRLNAVATNIHISSQVNRYVDGLLAQKPTSVYDDVHQQILTRKDKQAPFHDGKTITWTEEDSDSVVYLGDKKIADKYNLTLHDPRPTEQRLRSFDQTDTSFEKRFEVAQKYLKKFNVDLRLPYVNEYSNYKIKIPSQAVLDVGVAQEALQSIVDVFGRLPQEYVDMADNNHTLEIMLTDDRETDYSGLAFTDGNHNHIALGVGRGIDDGTVEHELTHLIDTAMAGGPKAALNDPEYEKLNYGIPYRDGSANNAYVAEGLFDTYNQYGPKVYKARRSGDYAKACDIAVKGDLAVEKAEESIVFASKYASQRNVVEDKAEVGLGLVDSVNFMDRNSVRTPRVREKFTLFAKRLASYRPRLAGFFITRSVAKQYPLSVMSDECSVPLPISPGYKNR